MKQLALPIMGRMDGPGAVSAQIVHACKTYRQAVRLAARLSRAKLTPALIAAEIGGYKSHASDDLNKDDKPGRRNLPPHLIPAFEGLVGNTLVSQWIARQAGLTITQEMEATMKAPLNFEQLQLLQLEAA